MILAVDTSCYTTSMIVIDSETGKVQFEMNKNLSVKPGERGLRQSEGFFQHMYQLTETYEQLCRQIDVKRIKTVAVSSRPRTVENSYMPVFHAGLLFCTNVSNTLSVPLLQYSHQDGHLMAAVTTSTLDELPKRFYGLHLSGGTTEVLDVLSLEDGFQVDILGGTLDLNFGQLIDRIGVQMGLSFPCGKEMDMLAQTIEHQDYFKVKFKTETTFNLSGYENKYMALIQEQATNYISRHLFNTIAHMIVDIMKPFEKEQPIVISGGVASNSIIREIIGHKFPDKAIYFALPEYSRDNALGIAELARRKV